MRRFLPLGGVWDRFAGQMAHQTVELVFAAASTTAAFAPRPPGIAVN